MSWRFAVMRFSQGSAINWRHQQLLLFRRRYCDEPATSVGPVGHIGERAGAAYRRRDPVRGEVSHRRARAVPAAFLVGDTAPGRGQRVRWLATMMHSY